jgi:hypothetical protein
MSYTGLNEQSPVSDIYLKGAIQMSHSELKGALSDTGLK